MSVDRSSRIAVLGCDGFIGSHLCKSLLDKTGYLIEGIDRADRRITGYIDSTRFNFHKVDIEQLDTVLPIVQRCGTVVSLAALCNPYLYTNSPISVIESNYFKIYPLIKACSEFQSRLIHFSTSEVYGKTIHGILGNSDNKNSRDDYILEENTTPFIMGPTCAQRWCYASAKQLLERTIYAYGYERDLDYTIVRPFNFIGSGMDYIPGIDGEGVPRVFACFMDSLLHKKPLLLVDGGKNRRCFTAIDDAISAVITIIDNKEASNRRIFNIGNPRNETTIQGLADTMIALFCELLPEASGFAFTTNDIASVDFYGEGYEDSDRRVPSIETIGRLLGWQPVYDLEQTLRMAMAGFLHEYLDHSSLTGAFDGTH